MKQLFVIIIMIIAIAATAFKVATYDPKLSTGEAEQIQGVYVFVKSKPVKEYEFVGTVKGPTVGSHEFDVMLEVMVKKMKKEFPSANAIIFDGGIRQTHNTKASAVKIKE